MRMVVLLLAAVGLMVSATDKKFYTKKVEVEGFAITGSKNVSDFALAEAAFLIRQMLGERKDILRVLAKHKIRFAIIAHNESTTDLPEYRKLQPRLYWNRRTRGLGPSEEILAVSCGEENLLGYPGDPYREENILIHEFAHAIHTVALAEIDATFDERLEAAHEAAVKAGLWKGKYAGRNRHEYWAEGVQSWFDTNRPPDHDHNHVDTRDELKEYDPALAKLVKEILGESKWRYQRPADRRPPSPHLKGYNATKAPLFSWDAKSTAWYQRFRRGEVTLAPEGAVDLKLLPPDYQKTTSPQSKVKTGVYVSNNSRRTLGVDWMDFGGKPRRYGTLRKGEHFSQRTFAGHVWRLVDVDTGKVLHHFLARKKPAQLIWRD